MVSFSSSFTNWGQEIIKNDRSTLFLIILHIPALIVYYIGLDYFSYQLYHLDPHFISIIWDFAQALPVFSFLFALAVLWASGQRRPGILCAGVFFFIIIIGWTIVIVYGTVNTYYRVISYGGCIENSKPCQQFILGYRMFAIGCGSIILLQFCLSIIALIRRKVIQHEIIAGHIWDDLPSTPFDLSSINSSDISPYTFAVSPADTETIWQQLPNAPDANDS